MTVVFRIFYILVLIFCISACKRDQKKSKLAKYKKIDNELPISNKEEKVLVKDISKKWQGKYEGSFIRLSQESADPRAWASLELEVKSNELKFYYFSYLEQDINQVLKLREEKSKSLSFGVDNKTELDNKCLIYLKEGEFLFESAYINKLMKGKQIIKLDKIFK